MIRFAEPWALLLAVPALLAAARAAWRPSAGSLGLPAGEKLRSRGPSARARLARWASPVLQGLAAALVAVALAAPQKLLRFAASSGQGIDIVLAIDSSLSMAAMDFKPSRLEAAKETARRFVLGRTQDRIGLVTFGGAPLLACPPTLDYDALLGRLAELEPGMTRAEGTAIGDGLAAAAQRLKDSAAKSKVIVLLTDGRSNVGAVDPVTAAKAAAAYGIKVYAIGTASKGQSVRPVDDPNAGQVLVPVDDDLDEELLAQLASITDGQWYRAQNGAELKDVFARIDKLEKSKVSLPRASSAGGLHAWPLAAAVLLLLAEAALSAGPLLRWP